MTHHALTDPQLSQVVDEVEQFLLAPKVYVHGAGHSRRGVLLGANVLLRLGHNLGRSPQHFQR